MRATKQKETPCTFGWRAPSAQPFGGVVRDSMSPAPVLRVPIRANYLQ
jgi:hypothetical protein